jgi:hypothetical protein
VVGVADRRSTAGERAGMPSGADPRSPGRVT